MKLQIQANSIRVRMTQSEVRQIADGSLVEQTTALSPLAKLRSRVECSLHVQTPIVILEDQCLAPQLPSMEARQRAKSD